MVVVVVVVVVVVLVLSVVYQRNFNIRLGVSKIGSY